VGICIVMKFVNWSWLRWSPWRDDDIKLQVAKRSGV